MTAVDFSDLLDIRKGGEDLTSGGGNSGVVPVSSVDEWEQKAAALKELYGMTLGRAPYTHAIDFDIDVSGETDCGDYVKRDVVYNTGPHERITAYMLIPKSAVGRTPAVLCLHQTIGMGKEQIIGNDPTPVGQDLAIALHLVKRGFITFAYDLLAAGERCYPGLEPFDTAPFYKKYPEWSVRGKDLYDVARAIDVLQTMPEVDPDRIGSIGHSQGGGNTIHAMAVESRIKAGVSNCGIWPCRIAKNPYGEARTVWWVGRPALRPFCLTGKPFPSQIQELMALAAPRALMNISALNDCQYSVEEKNLTAPAFENMAQNIRKVFRLYGRESAFASITHLNGHSFNEEQRHHAYSFLDRHLKYGDTKLTRE